MSMSLFAGRLAPETVNFVPIEPEAGSTLSSFRFAAGVDGAAIGPGRAATPASFGGVTACGSAEACDGSRSAPAAAAATSTEEEYRKRFLLIVVSPCLAVVDDRQLVEPTERERRELRHLALGPAVLFHHDLVRHRPEWVVERDVP